MSSETITRNDLEAILNEIFPSAAMLDFFYPVGSYYETSDITFDPNVVWPGTWVLEAEGLAHVSAGTTYTAGLTYGTNTHNHTTGDFTLLTKHLPAHTHGSETITYQFRARKCGSGSNLITASTNVTVSDYSGTGTPVAAGSSSYAMHNVKLSASHTHNSVGSDTAHNHGVTGSTTRNSWQPSMAVNRWHRTA